MAGTIGRFDRDERVEVLPVIAKGRRARAAASEICANAAATQVRVCDAQVRALDVATAAVDRGPHSGSTVVLRLERLAGQMGRSPVIEQAKARLVEQYCISPGEAFDLLVLLSNNSNRKLRDVAAQLVHT